MPLLLASTTAGTGSEVTPTATIWDFAEQRKHSFFGSQVLANVALTDPKLCVGAPWIISRDAAIDALSHALEAIWNKNRTEETTSLAILAAKKICHYLPLLRKDLDNLEIREQLSEAALSAGLAMAKTQTALAHALSYSETAISQKSHGQSCAYWLPYVWQLLIESDCDPKILLSLNQAVDQFFSTPVEMHQWLHTLGLISYSPLECDKTVEEQVGAVRLSARGKNFAGFGINGE
jgi:alcohol dehydrogenase class IV